MKLHISSTSSFAAVILASVFLTAAPAFGDPPEGKGKGRDRGEARQGDDRDDDRGKGGGKKHKKDDDKQGKHGGHFRDEQKVVIREYYGEQFRGGRCPPGLAKKHNGCMPPGQAKKYRIGQRLPPTVVVYEVPQPVVMQLGPPPSGHKYVRVAADILLIAVGTGMVVDAIQDLNRM
jgi:Ni/Co efflux regulator RcnB